LESLDDDFRALVVDNGSVDGSADVARSLGARVIDEPRRGFGAACWAGLVAAEAEIVCFMDCDASFDGADLHRVAAPVVAGRADLVMGTRVATARGAFPWRSRIANRAVLHLLRRATGRRFNDLGPMRAARRDALLELGIHDRRYGWPLEMVARAVLADWRIDEVEVRYRNRVGTSKVTGTLRGTQRTIADMRRVLREIAHEQP
jgi:dTDP-L-rhamnose 4-epimerase